MTRLCNLTDDQDTGRCLRERRNRRQDHRAGSPDCEQICVNDSIFTMYSPSHASRIIMIDCVRPNSMLRTLDLEGQTAGHTGDRSLMPVMSVVRIWQ